MNENHIATCQRITDQIIKANQADPRLWMPPWSARTIGQSFANTSQWRTAPGHQHPTPVDGISDDEERQIPFLKSDRVFDVSKIEEQLHGRLLFPRK